MRDVVFPNVAQRVICETPHRRLILKFPHVFGAESPVRTPFMHPNMRLLSHDGD